MIRNARRYQEVFLKGSVSYPLAIRHVSGKVTEVYIMPRCTGRSRQKLSASSRPPATSATQVAEQELLRLRRRSNRLPGIAISGS